MSKIVALSKFGFKLDSLKNSWEKIDKSLFDSESFKTLRKGYDINIVGRNNKGFITDIKIISTLGSVGDSPSPISSSRKFVSPTEHNILKGQCLNIMFNSFAYNGRDLGHDGNRETAIRLAHRLLVELEDAEYYKW